MPIKKFSKASKRSNGVSVVIPAAGSGKRFRNGRGGVAPPLGRGDLASTPKLYSILEGQPLIAHVLNAFDSLPIVGEIIVALEPETEARFKRKVLSRVNLKKPVRLVTGGKTRAESVWNALKRVSKKSTYVCIHDGARPLIRPEWLAELMSNLNGWDGVVLGRSLVPTVKVFDPETRLIKRTLDRTELFEAETPQLIKKEALLKAYKMLGARAFQATDDVSLLEAIDGRVKAVTHSEPNVKVTTYQDLTLVRNLKGTEAAFRFGLGSDRHRLVPKRPFYLGGIRIPAPFGPLGHSDGDALLHAITDALLGAIGAGDIGDFFPNTSKRWKNVRSDVFLKKALELTEKRGFEPHQVDVIVILERPKLGTKKRKIQSRVAKLLSVPQTDVSIKAKTAEGFGPEGLGEAISCQAFVVLKPIQ